MNIERFTNGEFNIEVLPRGESFIVLAPGLAKGLAFKDAFDLVRNMADDEKGSELVRTPGGDQRVWHVTEPGFYRAIGQRQASRIKDGYVRDQVDRFQRWLYHEVLPALRKYGQYGGSPVPGNFPEPVVLAWEVAAAHLRQRYGVPVEDAHDLIARLKDAGVLKLTGTPRKEFRDLFWPVGRRFDVHAHALPVLATRVTTSLKKLGEAQLGVQTALELDAIARRVLEEGGQ